MITVVEARKAEKAMTIRFVQTSFRYHMEMLKRPLGSGILERNQGLRQCSGSHLHSWYLNPPGLGGGHRGKEYLEKKRAEIQVLSGCRASGPDKGGFTEARRALREEQWFHCHGVQKDQFWRKQVRG